MKKIITLIVASIITISILIIPKRNIAKAEEIITSIKFTHPTILNSNINNDLNQLEYNNSTNGIFTLDLNTTTPLVEITNFRIWKIRGVVNEYGLTNLILSATDKNTINTQFNQNERYFIEFRYETNQYINTRISSANGESAVLNEELFYNAEWNIIDYEIFNYEKFNNLKNIFWQVVDSAIILDTPTITLNWQTIQWQEIEYAEYYNVFRNGNLIGQTQDTQWVTITNGIYTIQACTTQDGYLNSEISNSVTQNNYNDMIGNGVNWYTFFSAWVDTTIHLLKSMINYEIWGINFFKLLQLAITIVLTWIIIKFVVGF